MPTRFPAINPDSIFLDRDHDGIVETVDLQIHLRRGCEAPEVLCAVLDLCAAIGFEAAAMDLPLVTAHAEEAKAVRHHLHIGLGDGFRQAPLRTTRRRAVLSTADPETLATAIRRLAARLATRGVTRGVRRSAVPRTKVTELGRGMAILADLFTRFPYGVVVLQAFDLGTAAEAANLAARLGLEALRLTSPLATPWREASRHGPRIYIGRRSDLARVPGFTAAAPLAEAWESGVLLGSARTGVPDILIYGDGQGLRRVLTFLSRFPMDSAAWETPWLRILVNDIQGFFRGPDRRAELARPKRMVWEYSVGDERREILALLRRGLAARVPSSSIEVEIAIARPLAVRQRFARTIRAHVVRQGLAPRAVRVTVLNAYKPGLSWLAEVVGRDLAGARADRIEITFQDFRERGLEEPLRWLQEIHPADEVLSRQLGISKDRIRFARDGRLDAVYRVRAWRGSRQVYERHYSPRYATRPYLHLFPRAGRVHPTTGWVRLVADDEEILSQRVPTPIERLWETYQRRVLPALNREAEAALARPSGPGAPLFEELRFDVWLDYPAEPLGIAEERVSPLEALHEDLYFVSLDFFGRWARRRRHGKRSCGRILPVMHPHYAGGGGRLRVTLVPREPESTAAPPRDVPRVRLTGLAPRGKRLEVGLAAIPASAAPVRRRWEARLCIAPRIATVLKTPRESGAIHMIASIPDPSVLRAPRQGTPLPVPLDRPLGYAEGVALLRSLSGLPGIRVREEGESFRGVPIFSLEVTHPCPSRWISHLKRRLFKPTLFINCRHHANEVSSTSAALALARLLATVPGCRRLLRGANVVINPMENVDGMAALGTLLHLTPTDKLHAARYNAAGQEYYGEYFTPEPRYGEAKVKPAIWRRWLPDICIDSHGFPSHEWEQPFSGYAPARFREFWIPRALIYLYLPHLEARKGSTARRNAAFLEAWLVGALSQDRRIRAWNARFGERYWKYRDAWLDGRRAPGGPVPCFPLDERLRKTNYAYRMPRITTVDLITEVADETAWGPYLRDCIAAHLQADLALIRLLNRLHVRATKVADQRGQEVRLLWHRDRPLAFQ